MYQKLIGCLGTCFSIEICQYIIVRIIYFLFIIILNLYSLQTLLQISLNSSDVFFSIWIARNLQKMFVNNETLQKLITEYV